MRSRFARGLVAVIALSGAACATPAAPGRAADAQIAARSTEVIRRESSRGPEALIKGFPALEGKKAIGEKPTAFVCKRGACEAPTSDPAALRRALAAF